MLISIAVNISNPSISIDKPGGGGGGGGTGGGTICI